MSAPAAPKGLGPAGRGLWRRLAGAKGPKGESLAFSAAELVTLKLAAAQADDLSKLEAQLRREGLVVKGSAGQPRLSALPAEIRLQRAALQKLVAALALPEVGEAAGMTPGQRRAQAAAEARWSRAKRARERRAGA